VGEQVPDPRRIKSVISDNGRPKICSQLRSNMDNLSCHSIVNQKYYLSISDIPSRVLKTSFLKEI